MGEPDLDYEAMLSDMAEWAHWSATVYTNEDNGSLNDYYKYYRAWPYKKLKSEWENFFGRDYSQ